MAFKPFGHRREWSNPVVCPICRSASCNSKHAEPPKPIAAHKPQTATHIAGYVPPKGSIAFALLGRVVQYR